MQDAARTTSTGFGRLVKGVGVSWSWVQRGATLLYLALFVVGCIAFLIKTTPAVLTPAIPSGVPTVQEERVNWASVNHGGRVRASIWDPFRNHHPLYLIDQQSSPTETEKWASLSREPTPWVEVALPEVHDIEEIVLYHAGWREDSRLTNDRYLIRCYRGSLLVADLGVVDNREPIARHPLSCPGVDRIWVAFDCAGRSLDVARIYEIEAWGAP